jgi:citrate lyase subunit gamma (acyl carrier protein)
MDCLVTVAESGGGRQIEISGSGASRFRDAMEKKIIQVLDGLGAGGDIAVIVQDNGAIDLVLGARVEAAYLRFRKAAIR